MPASRALRDRAAPDPRAGIAAAIAVVALAVGVWLAFGTPYPAVGAFGAYWLLAVLMPGTLVHKGLRGTQGSWLSDLTLGAVTGLCLELVAWLLFALVHAQAWLGVWPVMTLALLLSPSVRSRLRQRPDAPGRQLWVVATALAVCLGLNRVASTYFQVYDLPPSRQPYYVDLPWHMSLVAEAQRAFPLMTPQLATAGPVKYSWFVHAHMGAASLVSGVADTTVVLRLAPLPLTALAILSTAVVARRLTGSAGAGALAAWLTVTPAAYYFWPQLTSEGDIFTPLSPTQLYSLPISTFLIGLLADIVRRGRAAGAGTLALAVLAALATMGSKSSIMAMVFCGVVATLLAALLLRRHRRVLLVLTAGAGVVTVLALLLVTGGNYGTGVQLFSSFTVLPAYRALAGENDFTDLVPTGFTGQSGPPLLGALALVVVVRFALQLAFALPLVNRRLRGDLAAWLLAGTVFSAWVPFLVMGHRGYSEYYFMSGVVPFASILVAWWADLAIGGRRDRLVTAWVVGAIVAVASALVLLARRPEPLPATDEGWWAALGAFTIQAGVAGLLVLVAVVAAVMNRRRGSGALTALPITLLVAPMIGFAAVSDVPLAPPDPPGNSTVAQREGEASLWIREHVPADALVATNAQCLTGSGITCDARRWWISGVAGRRVLLEGWAYTASYDGTRFTDRALYDFNRSLFAAPTVENLDEARRRGVRWLVAEKLPRQPAVSADLGSLVDKRYDNGTVAIFELGDS